MARIRLQAFLTSICSLLLLHGPQRALPHGLRGETARQARETDFYLLQQPISRSGDALLGAAPSAQLRVYVAPLPAKFQPWAPEDLLGFRALGKVADAGAGVWDTPFHAYDKWWINQVTVSPLRVGALEESDVVFVPATLRFKSAELVREFFDEAAALLPALDARPHVLFLDHPLVTMRDYLRELFETHPAVPKFTIINIEEFARNFTFDFRQSIGAPYGTIHWHRGMPERRAAFNASAVRAAKKTLAVLTAVPRQPKTKPVRFRVHAHCVAASAHCTFVNWTSGRDLKDLASETYRHMQAAWYSLMPLGDFVTRSAFFDALLAGSLPVVFDPEYARFCPYGDVIDYEDFMLTIPAEEFMAEDSPANVVDMLKAEFDVQRELARLERLHKVAHVFQFSLNPLHELVRFDEIWTIHPEDDAFTFTWKAALRRLCECGAFPPRRCPQPPQAGTRSPPGRSPPSELNMR